MVILFISTLIQYLYNMNTTPQCNLACNFDRNPILGIFFSSYAMQGREYSIYIYAVSAHYLLVRFHFCTFCGIFLV